jgi:hypothetical protein
MTAHILGQTTLSLRERNYPLLPGPRLALGFSLLEMMAVVAFSLIVMTISTPIYHSAEVLKAGAGDWGKIQSVTTLPKSKGSTTPVLARHPSSSEEGCSFLVLAIARSS